MHILISFEQWRASHFEQVIVSKVIDFGNHFPVNCSEVLIAGRRDIEVSDF